MAKNEKNSFILHFNFKNQFDLLSMEQRGKLITMLFEYAKNQTVSEESDLCIKMAFSIMKDAIDSDRCAYEERCRENAENGKKGGRPKKNSSAPKTDGFFEKPKKPDMDMDMDMETDIDMDIDIDMDMEREKGKGNEKEINGFFAPQDIPLDAPQTRLSAQPVSDHAPLLTKEEKNNLLSFGIPEDYINEREQRACAYGEKQGENAFSVLLRWWNEDRASRDRKNNFRSPAVGSPSLSAASGSASESSYDIDSFFEAAVERSMELLGY